MFCRNCGNRIDDDDLFCSGCGNKVEPLPRLDEIDKTIVVDAAEGDTEKTVAYRGLIFEDREPSDNNAVQPAKEPEAFAEQPPVEQEQGFVMPVPQVPFEEKTEIVAPQTFTEEATVVSDTNINGEDFSEQPPVPDFSAVSSPLFSDVDELFYDGNQKEEEPEILQTPDTEDVSEQPPLPDYSAVTSPLFSDDDDVIPQKPEEQPVAEVSQTSQEEDTSAEEQESDEEKTVMFPEDDDWDKTILSPYEDNNVYSGVIPGVTSQEFSYPTMDKTYSVRSSKPELQAEDNVAAKVGYNPPAFAERDADIIQPVQPQNFVQQEFVSQNQNGFVERATPQNAYREPPEEPKKSKSVMWVVIACITVIVIAIGTVGVVFISQLDRTTFKDFFASFSDGKKDDDAADKDKGDKNKEEKTNSDMFAVTVENTTVEIITAPPTTERAFDGSCGSNVFYDYDEASRVLTIFGTGEMQSYEHSDAPWSGRNVARVVIEEGVTGVKEGSFTAISPDTIYVPSTVTTFDVLALSNFGGIEVSPSNRQFKSQSGVLFDKSGTMLIAYPNKSASTSYTIPSGVKIIGKYSFFQAVNLKSLSISTTVEYIDEYAFSGCYNISTLNVPANVTEIRRGIFYGWVSSQRINIANSQTKAVQNWNEGCSAVVSVAS